ncbi:MAG: Ig-like domain-containing protein [Bacteroidetes bacterium]|nr:Ig-like domain-containing protein [Bacteroidota bacterium]
MSVGTQILNLTEATLKVPTDQSIVLDFSAPLDTSVTASAIGLSQDKSSVSFKISFFNNFKTVSLSPTASLQNNKEYQLSIGSTLKGKSNENFPGVVISFTTVPATLLLTSFKIDQVDVTHQNQITNISLNPTFEFTFSNALNTQASLASQFFLVGSNTVALQLNISDDNKIVTLSVSTKLKGLVKFSIGALPELQGADEEVFNGYAKVFYTRADTISKFPALTDSALLDLVQQKTFNYFYDFAQPNSGMARERDTSGDLVTTGGSGFGLMALIVGIQRGYLSRADGLARFQKIISFLETAGRFHGAWPHWINGTTGKVIPFSTNDDGADLVETSYLIQGLLSVRQYLTSTDTTGNNLINRITNLYNAVEWDWFRQNSQNVLYWHWSPDKDWVMNMPIRGYNETLITYILAAGSSTHSIPLEVYQQGWADNGNIKNGKTFYGHVLPLGDDYGGPLFFTQYSFLGFDPHVTDPYLNVNFWTQNVNQSLINHDYCAANPKKYVGYSNSCWGLTASDNPSGYDAQSPTNDNGTISPTAAISSMPYTPTESMNAIKYFYYTLGDRMWGQYGFYDAINITQGWTATSYLAIDQGPIVVMIENYRTQLLWNLFMSAPEVQAAKTKLGFN